MEVLQQHADRRGLMAQRNRPRPSKNERTAEAREKARLLQEAHEHRERRTRFLVRWGVVAAVLAILVIIALIVVGNIRGQIPDDGPAPAAGNEFGGVVLSSTTSLVPASVASVDVEALPSSVDTAGPPPGIAASEADEPVQIVAYVDVNCVHCANFEAQHSSQIASWLDAGDVTIEYRNVAFLDRNSQTDYSSRGAAALACVADSSPEAYWDFSLALFGNFENGELSDASLADMASSAGAADISACLSEGTFRPFVKYATEAASIYNVGGTPTVYVDGAVVPEPVEGFAAAVEEALAAKA